MDDFNFSLDDDSTDNAAPSVPASQPDAQNALARRHTSLLSRIPVTLTLEVASVEIALSELLRIDDDSVIELDKLAGEPLDIKVNGILFGKAEVVVLNEKYGIRVLEFNSKEIDELAL
ncbi:MAG: flagellar motor switch protein FliN [Ewingella sp.]|uniref:flagellar motor switch protein FliN n=1 Tax=Ewingella TaxID=41201 RepID=UPI003F5C1C87